MRVFWLGIGTLALLTFVIVPYIASERCRDRWAFFNLDGIWNFETGCSVRIGGSLVREEYVSFDPRAKPPGSNFAKSPDAQARKQILAHPDWVTLAPGNVRARKGEP